jgi:hypothetical protein
VERDIAGHGKKSDGINKSHGIHLKKLNNVLHIPKGIIELL